MEEIDGVIIGLSMGGMILLGQNIGAGLYRRSRQVLTIGMLCSMCFFPWEPFDGVSLFQVGLATPSATVFAIVITAVYLVIYEKKQKQSFNTIG